MPTPARAGWRSANKLRGSKTGSFTYDANGNMLSYATPYSGYSFSYDARNRQTQAFVGAIGTGWLVNGLGQRIGQMNGSVPEFFFVYDEAGHQIGKYDGNGNLFWETAWLGDVPVAAGSSAGLFYIAPDHLGTPHRITDAGGAVAWQWNADPFGNGAPVGSFAYDLRFPGQFFDQATKLHYNYFRDYDPRTGRYIESDPIGLAGGVNTYAYAGGNPVSHTDPDGTQTIPSEPLPDSGYYGSCVPESEPNKDCKKASDWQLQRAGIYDEHQFKEDHLGKGVHVSRYDICACKDGSIVIKDHGACGLSGGTEIDTDYKWK